MNATAPTLPRSNNGVVHDCWNRIGVRGDRSCAELERHVHCRNCPVYTAAAIRLLDRELPADHLEEWTQRLAQPRHSQRYGTDSFTIFRLGVEWLALATSLIREVTEKRTVHALPHRQQKLVRGVVNVRGELLVCITLHELLGIDQSITVQKERGRLMQERMLVVQRDADRFVFPVSEIHGAERCHRDELKSVPSTLSLAAAKFTRAVLPWNERSVGCLDEDLLFYTLNRSLA
jgi:chemotaxis-related protein WspD